MLIWAQPRLNRRLQSAWFDTYQLLKPRELLSAPVTVVEIDEPSLARLGQWPWPRTVLAELIRRIARERRAAIGVDILMPEPDRLSPERLLGGARQADPALDARLAALPSSDSELARAIAEAPVVLGLAGTLELTDREPTRAAVRRRRPRVARSRSGRSRRQPSTPCRGARQHRPARSRGGGHGLISAGRSDDVIRRLPLVARIADRFVPSLPRRTAGCSASLRDPRKGYFGAARSGSPLSIKRFSRASCSSSTPSTGPDHFFMPSPA